MTCNDFFPAPWKVPSRWVPPLIFGLGILLLLPSIWSESSVTGQDEYWLSFRTPMEMNDRGEWLTPWLNGEPRLRKPPLIYWAILLNYKLFGVNLVAARIWGVLSGAGLGVCACLFSRELFQRTGLLAGLLALATMGVAVESRRAMLDLPAALFSTLAVLCFAKWLRGDPQGYPLLILLSAFWLALSFMTKGPVGFLFFAAGVLACLWVFESRSFLARNWWQSLLGVGLLAALCLPWPLAMHHLWSERFGRILGEEFAAREFGHWTPGSPLSAWSGALGLVLPWTPFMLAAIYSHFRHPSPARREEERFLLGWFLLSAAPFFFMKSFERYMLALLPAQIALAAEWLEGGQTHSREIIRRLCVLLLACISLVLCAFAWWFKLAVWEVIACLTLTGFAVFLSFRRAHPHWIAFSCALVLMVGLGAIYPRVGINALPENLSGQLKAYPVTLFNAPQPSLLSMRLGHSLQSFDPEKMGGQLGLPRLPQIVVVDAAHESEFFGLLRKRQLRAEQKGGFRTFYSRRAWVRFARPDAAWEDWKRAFRDRSLEDLKSEFHYFLVSAEL